MEEVKVAEVIEDPNVFIFQFGDLFTTVRLHGDALTITKVKKDEEKKTEREVGLPTTIALSAIDSIKKTKFFSFSVFGGTVVAGAGVGAILGMIFNPVVSVIVILLSIVLGIISAFPTMIVIKRKDGSKFTIKFGEDKDLERFVNTVFNHK